MFEDVFRGKKIIEDRLIRYGFQKSDSVYQYAIDICSGEFALKVLISADGSLVDTELIENESGEPYVIYKTNAAGIYVGEVRTEIEKVLREIVSVCYEDAVFKSEQAEMVIQYVRTTFGDELEFLWTKFPDNAVWRRDDNEKWYGAILTVIGSKIGLNTDNIVEIIDLRMRPGDAEAVLARENYYPGWHMNKKSWYTIVLDGSVSDEELKMRIDESYALAGASK